MTNEGLLCPSQLLWPFYHVNAAPAYCQDKNGIAERHWQTVVAMARKWLASAELPPIFWYLAVKRGTEICNYLDYHAWSKESTAAPVLSQLELRLLTAIAVHNKQSLKNCDVKQAFVQSTLPEDEVYFLKPPYVQNHLPINTGV